jgi:hypothetical protein
MSEFSSAVADVSSPPQQLLQMITGYWVSQALYVAAKLGIADLLADGPLHCDILAQKTDVHPDSLFRTLRALASVGVFSEVETRRFALNPSAALLLDGAPNSMRALAITSAEEQYRAWGEMLHSVRTGEPAFDRQFGMGLFEYFAQNPEAGAVFNKAMSELTDQISDAIANSYDFSGFGTIVDVGGNRGTLLAAILSANPGVQGVLFDRPNVVISAEEHLSEMGLEQRCECISGDFFESVPPGGDVYLLKRVLHDWDDALCQAILKSCRRAMPEHGKLLVVESVLPEGNAPHLGKWIDLHMLVVASGRERTVAEYRDLFKSGGFELADVTPIPGEISILEAVPV